MTTTVFRLDENFQPHDVITWYLEASSGETITISIPSRFATVQLIRRDNGYLHWWPEGGRGVTLPLDNAVDRLSMLQDVRPSKAERFAHRVVQELCL